MVHVTSEIGRLERVLVHEPGPEVDLMVPSMMEELLFDDILYGDRAREEHAVFRRVLQLLGVEVVEAADLLRATLGSNEARNWLVEVLLEELPLPLKTELERLDPGRLGEILVHGLRPDPLSPGIEAEELYRLTPLPNWCFQRDPQIVLGDGLVFSSMAAPARHRESLLARTIFRFHPELGKVRVWFDPLEVNRESPLFVGRTAPRLEGGDVLVMSPDVVVVGHSERTNRTAIHHMARSLARTDGAPRWLAVVDLPKRRAYMHLDTLMTPVDRDACLVYPPVLLERGRERARVYSLDLHGVDPAPREEKGVLEFLRGRGIDLEPIACGGSNPVVQQREQWTDGANALALAPGVITLYDRNLGTADALDRAGFRVVRAEHLLLGRNEVDLDRAARTCILLSSHEISRARGGPHCLSHPLARRDLDG